MPRPLDPSRESSFQAWIVREARENGWRCYHTFDPRNSAAGFPDLVLVRGEVLLAVEVKRDSGKLSDEQVEWLRALDQVPGVHGYVWRPRDRHVIEVLLALKRR